MTKRTPFNGQIFGFRRINGMLLGALLAQHVACYS